MPDTFSADTPLEAAKSSSRRRSSPSAVPSANIAATIAMRSISDLGPRPCRSLSIPAENAEMSSRTRAPEPSFRGLPQYSQALSCGAGVGCSASRTVRGVEVVFSSGSDLWQACERKDLWSDAAVTRRP
ncbi:MAG: hypothetical protein MZV70_22510 [Desulfobacterales bacterium]|nr:hypothetical protein [Desulfobacterales bacterium]